ncbi:MAG: ABC transporter ATP-binding protein [Chloroflexi bacterium]|jgi:putative ABC transport system ATP-binding protein|nr:ABC transporter ATP-binding protein [Chloroflexota bacterium]
MKTALQANTVLKTYQNAGQTINAVDHVSIEVKAGEFVALVGPSGSGKTTLLALLAGLLKPSAGQVLIDNSLLWQMNDAQRTRFRGDKIGFIFQASNLVPFLSAQENVELMLKLKGRLDRSGKARASDLLNRLGLGDRLNNLPSQMSGGQQQRVAIARALIHEPAVVLADEPTASLDTERAYQVVQTLQSLIHEQKRAGIMVTHDLRMCRYVDRVIRMRDGKVAQIIESKADLLQLSNTDH